MKNLEKNLKKLEEECEIDDTCLVIGEIGVAYTASSGNNTYLIQIYHSCLRSTTLKIKSHAKNFTDLFFAYNYLTGNTCSEKLNIYE